jgi:glycosyltransferase involved in cell wall biosynthesis
MSAISPRVSILMPAYNVGEYIIEAILSVRKQLFTDWELIVLNDGSSDNTLEIAQAMAAEEPRIRVYSNPGNLGMLKAWNRGIELCEAPYFVKLDADDTWHPEMLTEAVPVLEKYPEVGLVFTRYVNIDDRGRELLGSNILLPEFACNRAFSCRSLVEQGPGRMLSYPVLRQGLSVMRREVFDRVGAYRSLLTPETQAATDTEFYFRVGAHFKIYCIDRVLYYYRVHTKSISATDRAGRLTEQKLYEIKTCILRYYAEEGLLKREEADRFLRLVQAEYDRTQVAQL